ncbi:uncharacterized protein LOC118748935 [Rhagoletis pomonella]|uniref:uncharacterized protein LOC118748935 n=1 Tax=Rhagoletis pomonella TaxID=28610 RepID=UPI00177B9150|nr:uncharacterized protein LOC118748935 [Rhagoletis pomonella]
MSALATLSNPSANDSANAGGGSSNTGGGGGGGNNVERRCENTDCNVIKLVSMVPKRKITQFVTEPTVMEKPMLINGFTTVFQVEGNSAKLSDLKNPNPNTTVQAKTIFRIVPNTHAHIVNYVVVDADGDSLRKINEGDPATMRKLLESQKVSADQMLKKLMAGHGPSIPINCGNAPTPIGVNTINPASTVNSRPAVVTTNAVAASGTITPTINTASVNARVNATQASASSGTSAGAIKSSAIQLPMRMHPNLKITAVASRETCGQMVDANVPPVQVQPPPAPAAPTVPLITPVPLANLQNLPVTGAPTGDKPNIDKMQAELAELRRTVAMLAEAMPMNAQAQKALQQTTSQQQNRTVTVKRQRLN